MESASSDQASPPRSRRAWQTAIAVVTLLVIAAGVHIIMQADGGRTDQAAAARWGKSYLPNVSVVDHHGTKIKFYDDLIAGKIVVINFIYTSCRSVCPVVLSRLREVQDRLQASPTAHPIHFISISIDPIPDTPEKLMQQAKAFNITSNWTLVTGPPENIDVIRYKLGERSGQALALHKNEVLMFNDTTGSWSRDSAFSDLGVLAMNIRAMDPAERAIVHNVALATATADVAHDRPGQALFAKVCAGCHTIGQGHKAGPDLAGIIERRDSDWLTKFLMAPEKMHAAGDPVARELKAQFPYVRMPNLGLGEEDAGDLIAYLNIRNAELNAKTAAH